MLITVNQFYTIVKLVRFIILYLINVVLLFDP
jgi:hypothetical protein